MPGAGNIFAPLRRRVRPGSTLGKLAQEDFSTGFWRSTARFLIDPRGAYDLQNFMLDDDGSLYRRGGSTYKSNAVFGTGLRFLWDGYLLAGQRTVFASSAAFGVLAADDVTPVSLGGSGVASSARAAMVGGLLFVDGGAIYGGSRKAVAYSTGTITVTNGSTAVTGVGTLFSANVDAGMLLQVAGGRYYVVTAVNGDTSLTIKDGFEGVTGTTAYTLLPLGTAGGVYPSSSIYAMVADRLVHCEGNKVSFSRGRDPNTGQTRPHVWQTFDYHEIPEGGQVIGAVAIRDTLLVFATNGLWQIANMAYDIVDFNGNPMHRIERVTHELVLLSKEGIASWDNAFVAVCVDGCYRVDGVSAPRELSKSIRKLLVSYSRSGYRAGNAAVFRNHLFVPVLNGSALIDFLVCRLDKPVTTRIGETWPWTRLAGQGASSAGLTVRVSSTGKPSLLSAGLDGKVADASAFFEPAAGVKNDADGTTHSTLIETRDFPTNAGKLNLNLVRRLRVRYELVDAAADLPVIAAYFSVGSQGATQTTWGSFTWGAANWGDAALGAFFPLDGTAGADDGTHPFTWQLAKETRFIRARLQSSDPAASLVLRSVEFYMRVSVKDR